MKSLKVLPLLFPLASLFFFASEAKGATYCVGSAPAGVTCDTSFAATGANLKTALGQAGTDGGVVEDSVYIGPGTYEADDISYNSAQPVEIIGAGPDETVVTMTDTTSLNMVLRLVNLATTGPLSTASGLQIVVPANADVFAEYGVSATRFALSNIRVVGTTADNSTAYYLTDATLHSSSANMNVSSNGNYGIYTNDNPGDGLAESIEVKTSEITAPIPLRLNSTASSSSVLIDRAKIINNDVDKSAVWSEAILGPAKISNTLIQTQNNSEAIEMRNLNAGTDPLNLVLESVTLRRFAPGNDIAILVQADNGSEAARLEMSGVLISGYNTPLSLRADNGRTVEVISDYSAFNPANVEEFPDINFDTTPGIINFTNANTVTAAPVFVDAGANDFRPAAGSPMIDTGSAAISFDPLLFDLAGSGRTYDGDDNCSVARDIGAYEYDPGAQTTSFLSGPGSNPPSKNPTPEFNFASSWDCPGALYLCSLDGAAEEPCSMPYTTPVLADGAHTISVRAARSGGGLASPGVATHDFRIDATAPQVTIKGKSRFRARGARALVVFKFSATETSTYSCSLDGKKYQTCSSSYKKKLRPGKYRLRVKAKDAAGNISPVTQKNFRVVR